MRNDRYGFRITNKSGFHITFKNGITVSIQFGNGNYCRDYPNNWDYMKTPLNEFEMRQISEDAEVAVFSPSGDMIINQFDKKESVVAGFYTPEQVLKLLVWAEKYHPEAEQAKLSEESK